MTRSTLEGETRSLAGEWQFEFDADGVGVEEEWFGRSLGNTIQLPGTTNDRGKAPNGSAAGSHSDDEPPSGGGPGDGATRGCADSREGHHLTQRHPYEGAAWYRRHVSIPDAWADCRVVLTLERTRRTTVWVDGERIGEGESLSTPQQFDLTDVVESGEYAITIRVENDVPPLTFPGVQRSHAATEHTQTNWNGLVGDVALVATDPVWIDDVRVDADPATGAVLTVVTVGNETGSAATGTIDLHARQVDGDYAAEPRTVSVEATGARTTVEVTYNPGRDAPAWDEFSPVRIALTASLAATAEGTEYADRQRTTFGFRTVATEGTQFTVNGRTTFLRGTVDCCVFPRTGYPPTDRDAWREHLETIRDYGLNHVRFHSWCPPRAAFEAADELGLYLQPELPLWNNGGAFVDDAAVSFYRAEAERILDAYGNHPSFVMFALGNELAGDDDAMADLLDSLRERDGRRLYAAGAYNDLSDSVYRDRDDYWTTASVPVDPGDAEGDRHAVRATNANLENEPPSTDRDYAAAVENVPVPIVSHEIGQFQIYPDYGELEKYDGALRPDNIELKRDHLEAHGMLDRAATFEHASGQLAVRCYREEVEAAMRTAGFGGFELLALQDFPGQGTALVGLLDSFMDSKELIEPATWRRFCSPTVTLVRLDARTWTTVESIEATVAVANYGPDGATDVGAEWQLLAGDELVFDGSLTATDVPQGEVVAFDEIVVPLADVPAPTRATLAVEVPGLDASTAYDVWIYPPDAPKPGDDDGVTVRRAFDGRTRELLADGEDVLLVPDHDAVDHGYAGQFQPSFWAYALFKRRAPPGTMGPVLDPTHPALEAFPTEDHANWQWWHLLRNARPVRLEDAPDAYYPIVGMADNVERNHTLGLVFETAVGEGGLLVSTIDLFACAGQPTGRQLYASLAAYLVSDTFDPDRELSPAVLEKLFPG